jgi:hypothetical protein
MNNQPDVVLMDINLEGGREGIEVARWLHTVCDAPIKKFLQISRGIPWRLTSCFLQSRVRSQGGYSYSASLNGVEIISGSHDPEPTLLDISNRMAERAWRGCYVC